MRLFRSLDALGATKRRRGRGLRATISRCARAPVDLISVRRRTRSCRQLPGQRARSPLTRPRCATRCGAPSRRSTWCRRWRSSIRSRSSTCSSGCWKMRNHRSRSRAAHLHWLLFTPFRYPPPPGGSRFRGPNDPGVFYGADEIRTACAELGYWRWRHLQDSPALAAMPAKPQTVFQVKIESRCRRLRAKPFARDRNRGPSRATIATAQAFGRRRAGRRSAPSVTNRSAIPARRLLRGAVARRVRPAGTTRAADMDAVRRLATASSGSGLTRSMPKSMKFPAAQWSPSAH